MVPFKTMQERDRFFRMLETGDGTAIPGLWFDIVASVPNDLDGFAYNFEARHHDAARVAVEEIEGVTGNRHTMEDVAASAIFNYVFGAFSAGDEIDGIDVMVKRLGEMFRHLDMPDVSDTDLRQRWGRVVAILIDKGITNTSAFEPSSEMIQAGIEVARKHRITTEPDVIRQIWIAMAKLMPAELPSSVASDIFEGRVSAVGRG